MKSMSDLPWDLVEEILSRVPITSLRAVRSTCKRWNILSKDQIFTKKHCQIFTKKHCGGKTAKEIMLNMTYDVKKISPVRFNLLYTKDLPSSIKKIGTMLTPVKINKVYQCDGLFLLVTMNNSRLVVWNPYLGHTRWIKPRNSYAVPGLYALGYDNKKNYKVLRRIFNEFEIYDFNSNSWRVLDITYDRSFTRNASLKGNTYYVTRDSRRKHFIICFDFTAERFGPCLQLPFGFVSGDVALSCVTEDQLAALATNAFEIWITTKIEPKAVSWSKFFKVDVQIGRSASFLREFSVFSFFIDKEKKIAILCGRNCFDMVKIECIIVGEDGYFQRRFLGDVFSYVPSSVQIQ